MKQWAGIIEAVMSVTSLNSANCPILAQLAITAGPKHQALISTELTFSPSSSKFLLNLTFSHSKFLLNLTFSHSKYLLNLTFSSIVNYAI